MLTKKDLKLIAELYNESREEFTREVRKLAKVLGDKFSGLEDKFSGLEDQVIRSEDKILKELADMRDELTITSGYSDRLENHEERIEILEKQVLIQ